VSNDLPAIWGLGDFVTLAGFTSFYYLFAESPATRFQCLSLASPRSKTASSCAMRQCHLKALKLPTFAREYEKVAMESAQDSADYQR